MKTPEEVIELADNIDNNTYIMQQEFETKCPDPKELEHTMSFDIMSIANLDAKLRVDLSKAWHALDKCKTVHGKVTNMCRRFYLRDRMYDVDEYAKYGWEWDGRSGCIRDELQYLVPADDIYAAYTLLLNARQRRVDMLKQNIGVLTERGRQYKTAVEYLKFRSGN